MKPTAMLSLVLTMIACGAAPAPDAESARHAEPVVELTLRTGDGAFIDLGDLRDAPTLVYIFTTYDPVSQASLLSVQRFRRMHPEVHVVGIAAEPNAELLVASYAAASGATFPVTYEPEEKLLQGQTPLGRIIDVPTFILLDPQGRIRERLGGYASERALERLLDRL